MILLSLKHPSACVVARFEEVGIMGEFVVFPRADNGYDIETDVGEEAADGAGEGVGGVDDVLFFLSSDGLERCRDGFLSPCLYLYDRGYRSGCRMQRHRGLYVHHANRGRGWNSLAEEGRLRLCLLPICRTRYALPWFSI